MDALSRDVATLSKFEQHPLCVTVCKGKWIMQWKNLTRWSHLMSRKQWCLTTVAVMLPCSKSHWLRPTVLTAGELSGAVSALRARLTRRDPEELEA